VNRQSISPVMRELSAYIAQALRKPLPAAVVEKTKHHLLDTLAAMLSGSSLLPGTAIRTPPSSPGSTTSSRIGCARS